jgi:hypothetical protein
LRKEKKWPLVLTLRIPSSTQTIIWCVISAAFKHQPPFMIWLRGPTHSLASLTRIGPGSSRSLALSLMLQDDHPEPAERTTGPPDTSFLG